MKVVSLFVELYLAGKGGVCIHHSDLSNDCRATEAVNQKFARSKVAIQTRINHYERAAHVCDTDVGVYDSGTYIRMLYYIKFPFLSALCHKAKIGGFLRQVDKLAASVQ